MSSNAAAQLCLDYAERIRALDGTRSVLVQAPAGSGKTNLLTRRFLRLLAEVDDPGQIVAITFTKAAAAEMRHRITSELEKAATNEPADFRDELSMETLARRAVERSRSMDWNLIELPAQLRITTIDAFCRELALQQPLLSGLGGGIDIYEEPDDLYRRAARYTFEQIDGADPELRESLATLLRWRDNGWQEMEKLLLEMLKKRDRWMQEFLFDPQIDWSGLRNRMERPFERAARAKLQQLGALLGQVKHAREVSMQLARFACGNLGNERFRALAELAEFPDAFASTEEIEQAREACCCLSDLLQTQKGQWRSERGINISIGFPPTDAGRAAKMRMATLIADLDQIDGIEETLASACTLAPARYTEDEWQIVRACFVLLRRAAAQLKVEFAEAGAVDYTEVAHIAMQVLRGEDGIPGESALAAAENIRHLLVDEFQDTSRRQHELVRRLIAAWPEREGRTCFVVGDPMQSIYFFRDADAELFPQVRDNGLSIPDDRAFAFDAVELRTNFRTERGLVDRLNRFFAAVFASHDGSGVRFSASESPQSGPALVANSQRLHLHFEFMPCTPKGSSREESERAETERQAAQERQLSDVLAVIRSHEGRMEAARARDKSYRIAVLGRTRAALAPIAAALRNAEIPFRAIELERLEERPEVMDALVLARALLNQQDRIAWLGLLRAPWCGLSLSDMHALAGGDDRDLQLRPVRELMRDRVALLSEQGRAAVTRVMLGIAEAEAWRAARPSCTVGTWIEHAWLLLGGAACVDAMARANVALLWKCLDKLPAGEQDLLGPGLDAALEELMAGPDPRADERCGVQLMTIHKSKGLEFEVVIVPEMQAKGGKTRGELLSWMERGLSEPDENGATEFLVAPISSKGSDPGKAKAWVDREIDRREQQEMRRLLYVAATRAREELHLFARLEFRQNAGELTLANPQESLLKTAWPAIEHEAREMFREWQTGRMPQPGSLEDIAAEGRVVQMAAGAKTGALRRLPAAFKIEKLPLPGSGKAMTNWGAEPYFTRHEGGVLSRALGVAVHAAFEELARLRATLDWNEARKRAAGVKPRLIAIARAAGLDPGRAERLASHAVEIALEASKDAVAEWILSPRREAASEANWAGVDGDGVHLMRVDRVFRAGLRPGTDGDEAWWIVDYKTACAEDPEKVLPELRILFAPQMEKYARLLRGLHGDDAVLRAGLYYPRMKQFDWWEI